jgi:hypothetical protein
MLTKHLGLLCFSLLSGLTTSLLTLDKVSLGKRKAPFFSRSFVLTAAATTGENERPIACLTPHEDQVYHFLQDIQNKDFRIVVIGNGAILESTHSLGPSISISPSPKSGVNLITFASPDKSFELHLQLSQVSKVDLVEKETPSRTMRILRLSDGQGKSICSLILSEDSQENAEWFQSMKAKYGETWQI